MKLTLGMSALTSLCHHCSAKHKLPSLKKETKKLSKCAWGRKAPTQKF